MNANKVFVFRVYETAGQTLCIDLFSIAHCNYSNDVFWSSAQTLYSYLRFSNAKPGRNYHSYLFTLKVANTQQYCSQIRIESYASAQ